jgi:hypothetical protein
MKLVDRILENLKEGVKKNHVEKYVKSLKKIVEEQIKLCESELEEANEKEKELYAELIPELLDNIDKEKIKNVGDRKKYAETCASNVKAIIATEESYIKTAKEGLEEDIRIWKLILENL